MDQLQAVRSGRWKLYLPLDNKRRSPFTFIGETSASLFDLESDLSESTDRIDQHPEVAARLMRLAEKARIDLGGLDRPWRGQRPAGQRPPGIIPTRHRDF